MVLALLIGVVALGIYFGTRDASSDSDGEKGEKNAGPADTQLEEHKPPKLTIKPNQSKHQTT